MKKSYPLNIAHRGLHDKYPENTIESFHAAWELGCDMVEFDIQLSKDNIPIVFHDDNLKRLCGFDELVYNCSSSELRKTTLLDSSITIPTLYDVMESCSKRPFYFELKVPKSKKDNRYYKEQLVAKSYHLLQRFPQLRKSYIGSFDEEILDIVTKYGYPINNLVITFKTVNQLKRYLSIKNNYLLKSVRWNDNASFDAIILKEQKNIFLWGSALSNYLHVLKSSPVLGLINDNPEKLI